MKHLKTINTGKSWVTCAKMLPFTHKLAVASFSRSMKIYDLNTYELCGAIQEIDYAPMSMDVWWEGCVCHCMDTDLGHHMIAYDVSPVFK